MSAGAGTQNIFHCTPPFTQLTRAVPALRKRAACGLHFQRADDSPGSGRPQAIGLEGARLPPVLAMEAIRVLAYGLPTGRPTQRLADEPGAAMADYLANGEKEVIREPS